MKRFASGLLALALGLAAWFPAGAASAEEKPALKVGYKMDGEKAVVTASLVNAKESKGTWTFSYYNEKVLEYTEVTALEETYVFKPEPGKQTPINVEYVGKIDGQDYNLKEQVLVEVKNNQDTPQPGGNGQNSGQNEQKQEVEMVVEATLLPGGENDGAYSLGLDAGLKDVAVSEGTWTVEVNGQKHEIKGSAIKHKVIPLGRGDRFTVNIEFTGTADGKQVTSKKTVEVHVPGFKVNYRAVDGKHELAGAIEGAKEVEGTWYIGVGFPDSEEAVDEKFFEGSKEHSVSHRFDLEPGEYLAVVAFEGKVDGVNMMLYDIVMFEVTEDGKGDVTQPSDDDKSPVVNPDKGKKAMDDAKKGGKLPKTATEYPAGSLAGLALLAGGLALLRARRTA